METNYIKEFVVLAECMSFSEASNLMFISQSSLSKHIQSLERDLGVTLFERTTRSIKLTEIGVAFLDYAQKIADLSDEARIAIDDIRNKSSSSLTIAAMINPQNYDLKKFLLSFTEAYPDISFQLVEGDENALYEMFQKKQVNIFPIFEDFPNNGDYTFMPIVKSHINAVFRFDHPLADRHSIELKQLAKEKLLLPARNTTHHRLIINAFNREGIKPDIVYEGSSVGCVDLVRVGMGISLQSAGFTDTVKDYPDISITQLSPEIEFRYGIGYRDVVEVSRAEKIYLSHMKKFELRE